MLYKLCVAAAVLGLAAAAPSSQPSAAVQPEEDRATALKEDNEVLISVIDGLRQKLNHYDEVMAEGDKDYKSTWRADDLSHGKYHDSDDACIKKGRVTYLGCLDDFCLTTQCEQKADSKEPFGGWGTWKEKLCGPKGDIDACKALESEHAMLEDIVESISDKLDKYEEVNGDVLLTPFEKAAKAKWKKAQDAAVGAVTPEQRADKKKYWMVQGKLNRVCVDKGNAAMNECKK